MLPNADDILQAWRNHFCRRFDVDPDWISERAVRGAVREANKLAKENDDEPAALFYAFCSRPRSFRTATIAMTRALVAAQATRIGKQLVISPQVFRSLCFSLRFAKRPSFESIRDQLAPDLVDD